MPYLHRVILRICLAPLKSCFALSVFNCKIVLSFYKMSTRSHNKSSKAAITTVITNKRVENSWILLSKDSLLENSSFCIITLPHPAHGRPAKYCLDNASKKIFEVVTFNEPHRSWFIGETVKSDGRIQMLTLINPVFLVLPRLKNQCSNKAVPLEHLLSEKGFDKVLDFIDNFDDIADLKGAADMKAYKYNEDKTLSWLEDRVCRVAKVLQDKNIHVTSGAVSATFITSSVSNGTIDEEFYLKYAFGIVSEYLQEDFATKLQERFNFKPDLMESVGNKRKSEVDCNRINKKMKCDTSLDENVLMELEQKTPEMKKPKSMTAKEKARQKAASGTKTISSFFTKK